MKAAENSEVYKNWKESEKRMYLSEKKFEKLFNNYNFKVFGYLSKDFKYENHSSPPPHS